MVTASSAQKSSNGLVGLLKRNPTFARVWYSEIVSGFGDWFNLIATATLIELLTGETSALGWLFALRMLSPFLVSLFAGVLADRFNRKWILIWSDILRCFVVLCFLLVQSAEDVWLLYVLTALQLGLSGLFVPARNAILAEIVLSKDLGDANALSSTTYAVMQAVGAATAGLMAGWIGLYETFVLDSLTYVVSAIFLTGISYQPLVTNSDQKPNILGDYLDGLRHLKRNRDELMTALQKGLNSFFITSGLSIITVILAVSYYPIGLNGSITIGLFYALSGLGTAISPLMARRFANDDVGKIRIGLVISFLISGIGMGLIALNGGLAVVSLGMFIRGIGGGLLFVFSTHLLLITTPNGLKGRVFSSEYAARTLMAASGALILGYLLDSAFGFQATLWLWASTILVPLVLNIRWLVRARPIALTTGEPGDRQRSKIDVR